jgi:hypothetical protein
LIVAAPKLDIEAGAMLTEATPLASVNAVSGLTLPKVSPVISNCTNLFATGTPAESLTIARAVKPPPIEMLVTSAPDGL